MGGVAEPGAVAEQGGPLGGGEAHFRGELAGLFHPIREVAGERVVEEHDGLGGEHAVLGAAKAQHVHTRAPGQVGGAHALRGQGGDGVGEARAIHVQGQPVPARHGAEGADFTGLVERAEFRGLGERERARVRVMHAVAAPGRLLDGGRGEFAVGARQRHDLGAAREKFGRAAFIHLQVRGLMAQDALVAAAESGEREGVGGGAVEDEENLAVCFKYFSHLRARLGGPRVVTVPRGAAGVGGGERGHGLGADPGGVVAGESVIGAGKGGHGRS